MTRKKLIKKTRYAMMLLGLHKVDARKISYCNELPDRFMTNKDRWDMLENILNERHLANR